MAEQNGNLDQWHRPDWREVIRNFDLFMKKCSTIDEKVISHASELIRFLSKRDVIPPDTVEVSVKGTISLIWTFPDMILEMVISSENKPQVNIYAEDIGEVADTYFMDSHILSALFNEDPIDDVEEFPEDVDAKIYSRHKEDIENNH